MNNIIVRKAVVDDAKDVHRLLRVIADLHREGRPDMFPGLVSKYTIDQVAERLSRDDSGVMVATSEDNVVGYVFCDIIKEGNGHTLYVDDLCVDPEARGVGIGKSLMDEAVKYGKTKKCCQLMLNVWEFN